MSKKISISCPKTVSCHLENNSTAVRTFRDYVEIMLPRELKHGAHHILGHVMLDYQSLVDFA
jgi:hypothetical protein